MPPRKRATHLHVAKAGEAPPAKAGARTQQRKKAPASRPKSAAAAPDSVAAAAESGDRRAELAALRRRLARAIDSEATPPRDLAALSRRLIEVSKEIEQIDARSREDHDDKGAAGVGPEAFDATEFETG